MSQVAGFTLCDAHIFAKCHLNHFAIYSVGIQLIKTLAFHSLSALLYKNNFPLSSDNICLRTYSSYQIPPSKILKKGSILNIHVFCGSVFFNMKNIYPKKTLFFYLTFTRNKDQTLFTSKLFIKILPHL